MTHPDIDWQDTTPTAPTAELCNRLREAAVNERALSTELAKALASVARYSTDAGTRSFASAALARAIAAGVKVPE